MSTIIMSFQIFNLRLLKPHGGRAIIHLRDFSAFTWNAPFQVCIWTFLYLNTAFIPTELRRFSSALQQFPKFSSLQNFYSKPAFAFSLFTLLSCSPPFKFYFFSLLELPRKHPQISGLKACCFILLWSLVEKRTELVSKLKKNSNNSLCKMVYSIHHIQAHIRSPPSPLPWKPRGSGAKWGKYSQPLPPHWTPCAHPEPSSSHKRFSDSGFGMKSTPTTCMSSQCGLHRICCG